MTPIHKAPARVGDAVTGARCSLQRNTTSSDIRNPAQKQDAIASVRLRFLARRLYSLGPVALGYFLQDLARGAPLVPTLNLELLAPLIRAYAVEPGPFVISGGRQCAR